jgi:hypothetical protein
MRPTRLAAALLATLACASSSFAGNGAPEAGSLLVFPCFDSTGPGFTAITVTNTNNNFTQIGNQFVGSVQVHFIYVNGDPLSGIFYCGESDRSHLLTPNDTLTVRSDLHNTSFERGYVYVYARNPNTGAAISWNYLIGSSAQISPGDYYELNPFVFRSGRGLADGAPTDFSPADGIRNFDGAEYERVVDTLQVPHFFGESELQPEGGPPPAYAESSLVLINLTGAGQFTAVVNFLVYNDNEQQFSASTLVRCWSKRRLRDINGVFLNQFLADTSDNAAESISGLESGWYRLDGGTAFSNADSATNAAILAVQIGSYSGESTANLPFTSGMNTTEGELLSQGIFHD